MDIQAFPLQPQRLARAVSGENEKGPRPFAAPSRVSCVTGYLLPSGSIAVIAALVLFVLLVVLPLITTLLCLLPSFGSFFLLFPGILGNGCGHQTLLLSDKQSPREIERRMSLTPFFAR